MIDFFVLFCLVYNFSFRNDFPPIKRPYCFCPSERKHIILLLSEELCVRTLALGKCM